jgi:ankyrin repeat protein
MYRRTTIVKLMNESNNKDLTPLMVHSRMGNHDIVKLLIRYGAEINKKTVSGNTALSFAMEQHKYKVAKLLVKHGADIGRTVTKACDDRLLINEMIKSGVNINIRDNNGNTVFHMIDDKRLMNKIISKGLVE